MIVNFQGKVGCIDCGQIWDSCIAIVRALHEVYELRDSQGEILLVMQVAGVSREHPFCIEPRGFDCG